MNCVLGRIGLVIQPAYDPQKTYEPLDLVPFQGGSYVAKAQTVGNPPTDTNYWVQISAQGASGTDGAPGQSAYAAAQAGGYVGTEAQFDADLASIPGKQNNLKPGIVTLLASGWANKQQTVSVPGLTVADSIIISASPDTLNDYGKYGVYALDTTVAGQITFACKSQPIANLGVNVLIVGVA